MSLIEFFIIYLACGAPFSVYYYLHSAAEIPIKFFRLKTILVFFFWMPFAVFLLRQNKISKTNAPAPGKMSLAETDEAKTFYSIQKQIEKITLESDLKISIYEFREIIERYIGLTLINQNTETKTVRQEAEIYRVTQAKNVELSSICFYRRNRNRLSFHQTEARNDFLRFIEKLSGSALERNELGILCFKVVRNLNDPEAMKSLEDIFADTLQTDWRQSVKAPEKDLWKPQETRKPQPTNSIPIMSRVSATTHLRRKD